MNQDGLLFINNDDENSHSLDTKNFQGKIITIGINKKADYRADNINYIDNGMSFEVIIDKNSEKFFIPTFGFHNIYNALFAIALTHHLNFSVNEIRYGLNNYIIPVKRLNLIKLSNKSVLIDDTANANPQSVKAAIDVLSKLGENYKKIVVLGDMLELGNYSKKAHKEIGQYIASKKIDVVITYGKESRLVAISAANSRYPNNKIKHFVNRKDMHSYLKNLIEPNTMVLVKGSSALEMNRTVKYICDRYFYSILIDPTADQTVNISEETLKIMNIKTDIITLHFGNLEKNFNIVINNNLEVGKIIIPGNLTEDITIPELPYEYYIKEHHINLGPVIGLLILPLYYDEPERQLLRFSNYDKIKGLIFLFKRSSINFNEKIITGYYYNHKTKNFNLGKFPFPSVIFNRIPLSSNVYKYLVGNIGKNIFNYPYTNTDKMLFWSRMSKVPDIRKHLPLTREYKNINDLSHMLRIYNSVYLKPTTLAGGNGIMCVKKVDNKYILIDQNGEQATTRFKGTLSKILNKKFIKGKKYIVQQDITYKFKKNKLDFRVYLQKDQSKNWRLSGIETKVAKESSIISNSKNRERILPGKTTLQEIYHLNKEQTENKIKEITKLCISVLKIMESNGSIVGDVAVDLVIDQNKKVWLLEVQINYAAEIKATRTEDEREILPYILPTPFEYAKALAGF